jgi:hypothetical protein
MKALARTTDDPSYELRVQYDGEPDSWHHSVALEQSALLTNGVIHSKFQGSGESFSFVWIRNLFHGMQ